MRKIINVPIESLEERYSEQWNKWFPREFESIGIEFETVYSDVLTKTILTGSFLDVFSTNYFKAGQLKILIEKIYGGLINNDDIIFFHDLWFPGIEMLQYIRQGAGLKFKIAGILHAGTYDPFDFLSKRGMCEWGEQLENCWFKFVDKIFVATDFHKKIIIDSRIVDCDKIVVTGLPIYFDEFFNEEADKENIIIFPHRLDEEKRPMLFDILSDKFKNSGWRFLKTKEETKTKQEYYSLLSKSKIAVSFAEQETWGIAQQESLACYCIPVVPRKLSYNEMYFDLFKYDSFEECCRIVENIINDKKNIYESAMLKNRYFLDRRGQKAIRNIIEEIRKI